MKNFFNHISKPILLVIRGSGIAFIIILTALMAFQKKLIFFPEAEIIDDQSPVPITYENIFFTSSDGKKLNGRFYPCPNASYTVIFCHGNGGNVSYSADFVKTFYDLGLNVFSFDYRGYGRSEGTVSEDGCYLDVLAAWDYLTQSRKIPQDKIIAAGHSMGGAVAIYLATLKPIRALILQSTFTSIPDVAAHLYPYLPARLLCLTKFPSIDRIKNVNCPVIITHGIDDKLIPIEQGKKLFQAAGGYKEFIATEGSHGNAHLEGLNLYKPALEKFLRKITAGNTANP